MSAALSPELEALVSQLREGLAAGASPAVKTQAAAVCRLLLVALDAKPGQPLNVADVGGMPGAAPTAGGAASSSSAPPKPEAPPAASSAAQPAPPPQPPNLLDLFTAWAKTQLPGDAPPRSTIPYVGVGQVVQMAGVFGRAFGGGQ